MNQICRILLAGAFLSCLGLCQESDTATARRKRDRDVTMKILPPTSSRTTGRINAVDKTWEDWVRRTGELPPDFQTMRSIPGLPEPLVSYESGRPVPITTLAQWKRQRDWIRGEFERWVFGRMPPAPGNLTGTVVATRADGECTVQDVLLRFGPEMKGSLRLQLIIPPGPGPFPVFLTNHPRIRPWINVAVRRGYMACIYFAADPRVTLEADDADKLIELYPDYDFACLGRWAWAAMRAVDYLESRKDVDRARIGLTGHSRGGKQALLAAAFDERIGAVIPLSGNTGEGTPWRYTTDMFVNESIEQITGSFPHWFHPRLRFFAGREHKLPVDQNLLVALVAPRPLLLDTAHSEEQGNPWGFEQTFRSALEVYRFLKGEDNLGLCLRPGEHMPSAEEIEFMVDFFDRSFGRKQFPRRADSIHGYTFERWKSLTGERLDPRSYPRRTLGDYWKNNTGASVTRIEEWNDTKREIQKRIRWALGDEPPGLGIPANRKPGGPTVASDAWIGDTYKRPVTAGGMKCVPVPFGDELKADLYYPAAAQVQAGGKLPVVVWLHPYSYATGYSRYAAPAFASLGKRGFAVLAFDQIGFGTRLFSAGTFYARYPRWSLMGKMVNDTRAAITALEALDMIDGSRISLFGWALGAKIGLFTAALDSRVRAVAAANGFSPLRLEGPDSGTEGLSHYSHLHGLMPLLGFFIGHEDRLPIDYDEVLAAIAPRSVLVIAPELDRYAPVDKVRRAVESASAPYKLLERSGELRLETPYDFNRLPRPTQERAFDWLAERGR